MFTEQKPDPTALARQQRRLRKLKKEGVSRSTVFIHESCKPLFESLRPLLLDIEGATSLQRALEEVGRQRKPTNVSQIEQLSPFRYPGGKTWLVPEIRNWLKCSPQRVDVFIEPFAGGAMAGLTAAAEGLAGSVVLSELDEDVASVWTTIFDGTNEELDWLCEEILRFEVRLDRVQAVIASIARTKKEKAFRTIVRNRTQRGGIMATGAGLVKVGEGGRGLASRWYPETLVKRIRSLRELRNRITFQWCDGFQMIGQFATNPRAAFFIDPPYTAGGKKAGSRLYTHSEIDHEQLFRTVSKLSGKAMLSYDDSAEVRQLARKFGLRVDSIPMKSTHHAVMQELVIFKT